MDVVSAAKVGDNPGLRVFTDEQALAQAAASSIAELIATTVGKRGRCALALSGGSTPRGLYQVLAADFRERIPWRAVHLFWGDERFVPATDPRSNYGMAKAALLDHVPCPAGNIHPIPTHLATAAAAAETYEAELHTFFGGGPARFDLILLGIGEDGHTASLFPHAPALTVRDRLAVATAHPSDAIARITVTMPVLEAAETVFVLVAGERKAGALARALAPATTTDDCPACALTRTNGNVVWWTDRAAAGPANRVT